jgi:hypothetical protein
MNRQRGAVCAALLGALSISMAAPRAHATTVKHFDLDRMTASAARVFRGTVTDIRTGSVFVGGAQLATTTYRFRVIEAFKGVFPTTKGNVQYAEVTMIGTPKVESDRGGARHFSIFRDMPRLERGRDYLLFLTAESKVALSSPVGLGQGCFDIDIASPGQPTANRVGNAGLVAGVKGPVPYDQLAARVRAIVAAQKGNVR